MRFEFSGTSVVRNMYAQQHNINDVEVWDSRGVSMGKVVDAILQAIW